MRKSIVILLLLSIACNTPFDPKIDKDTEVVVSSFFRPNAPFRVNLSTTNFILDDPENLNFVSDALVTVSDSNGVFEELSFMGNGNYGGSRVIEDERSFSLNISVSGYADLSSSDMIPEPIAVSKFEVDPNLRAVNLEDVGYPSKITFNDPIGKTNYYALETILVNVSENPSNSGNFLAGEVGEVFFEDTTVK